MCGAIFAIPSFNTIINRVYSINSSSFSHHHPIQTPPSTQHQSPFDAQDCSIAPSGSSNVPPFTSPPSSTNHFMPLQSIYASFQILPLTILFPNIPNIYSKYSKYCLSPSSFTIFQILPLTILSPGSPMPLFASGILGGQRAPGDCDQAKPHPHLKVIEISSSTESSRSL